MRLQPNLARRKLVTQTTNGTLQNGAPRFAEMQIAKSQPQQLRIGISAPEWGFTTHDSDFGIEPHEHFCEHRVRELLDHRPTRQDGEPARGYRLHPEYCTGQLTGCRTVNVGITTPVNSA